MSWRYNAIFLELFNDDVARRWAVEEWEVAGVVESFGLGAVLVLVLEAEARWVGAEVLAEESCGGMELVRNLDLAFGRASMEERILCAAFLSSPNHQTIHETSFVSERTAFSRPYEAVL